MRTTYAALAMCALFGLSLALTPAPVGAAALPAGVSDQVTFSGTLIGQTPQVFNFMDTGESGSAFNQISLPAGVSAPSVNIFGMNEPSACAPAAVGCPFFSDIISFTTSTDADTGAQTLVFTFNSDSETPLQNGNVPSSCVEGAPGCGDAVFQVNDTAGANLLTVSVASDPDVPGVPEPSTLLLMGSGLAGAAVWGRKALKLI
jgi:PEP-CTERM motif